MGTSASRPERQSQQHGLVDLQRSETHTDSRYAPQQVVSVPLPESTNFLIRDERLRLHTSLPEGPSLRGQLHGRLPFYASDSSSVPGPVDVVPRLNVQQTCVVKNPVNLIKPTLRCHQKSVKTSNGGTVERLEVSFLFDASTEVEIAVHYFSRQVLDATSGSISFVSRVPGLSPAPRCLPAGMKQLFCVPLNECIEVATWEAQQALLDAEVSGEENSTLYYPLTISLRSLSSGNTGGDADLANTSEKARNKSIDVAGGANLVKNQYTFAKIVRPVQGADSVARRATELPPENSASAECSATEGSGTQNISASEECAGGEGWPVQIIKQKIQFGTRIFEVQEIYGIERGRSAELRSSASEQQLLEGGENHLGSFPQPPTAQSEQQQGSKMENQSDFLTGRECVICLAEERNTAVLPCRHMCLCSGCANIMRMQSNKCPICRQPVTSLLQITIKNNVD